MERIVEYGVHVIVATRRRGKWRWFVSEKEDWFLAEMEPYLVDSKELRDMLDARLAEESDEGRVDG
mgnify:CR=1 FL=1